MSIYDNDFYRKRHENTQESARKLLAILVPVLPKLDSAADVGCGVGTWIHTLTEFGASEIQGFDGPWVDTSLLVIPEENFQKSDLNKPIKSEQRYDLAISLEVAEHIKAENAPVFVASLVGLSDIVLFSAAIPYQGGIGHINEQWPAYWIDLFDKHNYVPLDIVRRKIWEDDSIPVWYRQNTLVFVNSEKLSSLKLDDIHDFTPPEKYLLYYQNLVQPGIRQSVKNLIQALTRKIS